VSIITYTREILAITKENDDVWWYLRELYERTKSHIVTLENGPSQFTDLVAWLKTNPRTTSRWGECKDFEVKATTATYLSSLLDAE
jgi:hypothetical protein